MESHLCNEQLQKSLKAIKADAIRFLKFCVWFLIYSLLVVLEASDFETTLYCIFLNLSFLLAAILEFICSKTNHKSYLLCYSFTLVIIAIYLGTFEVRSFKDWADELHYTPCEYDSCLSFSGGYLLLIVISGLFILASYVLIIITIVHSIKFKGLLSCKVKEYQVPLMEQEGIHK